MTLPPPTPVRVLSGAEITALLPMDELIEVMAEALASLARGEGLQPLRQALWLPDRRGLLGLMPGMAGDPTASDPEAALGLKVVTVFLGNHGAPDDADTDDADDPAPPSHQGVVMLFDPAHGTPLAILDAASITARRTAAVSALATRLLAREDAGALALLGCGVQAASHLEALAAVRPLREVRVWSRTPDNARAFAQRAAEEHGVPVIAFTDPRETVVGADLVCTVTSSREPVLEGAWLSPGCHVNAVGACTPGARELDARAVARARLIVDRRESALAEAGDFLLARQEGAVADDHIAGELGEVLVGRVAGRQGDDEITLFESLGLAVEDLATAREVLARAEAADVGTLVHL